MRDRAFDREALAEAVDGYLPRVISSFSKAARVLDQQADLRDQG